MNSNKFKTPDLKTLQCPFHTSLSFTMTKSVLWTVNRIFILVTNVKLLQILIVILISNKSDNPYEPRITISHSDNGFEV